MSRKFVDAPAPAASAHEAKMIADA
eukprot:COSAG02_NODE_54885_length_293_cov_1.319588_1_plen_24_part_10